MARKADIKICRFSGCNHTGKLIITTEDDYISEGKAYYHRDCFINKEQKMISDRLAKDKEINEKRLAREQEIAKKRLDKERELAEKRLAKKKIKKCGYYNCCHENKVVDTTVEEFVVREGKYYHIDCWENFEKIKDKEDVLKADIQLLKNMWIENISNTVPLAHLYKELNIIIRDQGVDSKYVIFVLDYCIKNKCNLRYPGGLKYYVYKQEIKSAFAKKETQKRVAGATFCVDAAYDDNSPKFSVNKKPTGFSNILNRRK